MVPSSSSASKRRHQHLVPSQNCGGGRSLFLLFLLVCTLATVNGTLGGFPLLSFVSPTGFSTTKRSSTRSIIGVPVPPSFKTHQDRSQLNIHHGIPKLFRWLVDLYPIVLESVGEGLSGSNAMAVDNFYLDMNGIIHTCTHTNNDKLVTLNEREMFQRIFSYTDRLYKLVRPSRLMFLAVDGVAPRAKMNQQRSRRFRSSKEREALLADYVAKEGKLPDEESFDSNCITPGFFILLAAHLLTYPLTHHHPPPLPQARILCSDWG